jgi:hypothetical protein
MAMQIIAIVQWVLPSGTTGQRTKAVIPGHHAGQPNLRSPTWL